MSESGKRKVDDVDDDIVVSEKRNKTETPFEMSTRESKWSCSESERDYVLRYIYGDICTKYLWTKMDNWPTMSLPKRIEWPPEDEEDEEEGDFDEEIIYKVIAAIWTAESQLVGIWGMSYGHVGFYVTDAYEHAEEDLNKVSGVLCGTFCRELSGSFDDGSGIERKVKKIPADLFNVGYLNNLYIGV